jgi:Na+/melibiose symporter-like transporter
MRRPDEARRLTNMKDVPQISSTGQKVYYSFGQFANGVYNGVNSAILGLYVSAFTGSPFIIGYVSNTRTIEGSVIQPLVGRWSDRTKNRLGRRRPFILVGIPISVFFLALVPVFSHLGHGIALPLIVIAIILFSITWNVAGDPYQALMVDITPAGERNMFNAILGIISLVGQVLILAYAALASVNKHNIPDSVFYACVVSMFIAYAVVFLKVREPKEAPVSAQREERIPWRAYVQEVRDFREAAKLLVSIFFLWTGLNAVLPFLTVFTKKEMHVGNSKAIVIYLIIVLAAGAAAVPFARLAARYGTRRMIVVGTAILIVASLAGVVAPTYVTLFPVAVLAGIGFSATTVLTYPYLSQLVSANKIGAFTGLQTSFASIAVPLSTGLTAAMIHFFGYRVIFAVQAVMMAIDILFLLSIDDDAARRQVDLVDAEDRGPATQPLPSPA